MKSDEIPQTDSIQELPRLWGMYDVADFEDELEEVAEPVFERATVVQIRLQPEEAEAVEQIAKSKGVGYADLIREWVLQNLRSS